MYWLSCTSNGYFNPYMICNMHWSMQVTYNENIGSLSYEISQTLTCFIMQYGKIIFMYHQSYQKNIYLLRNCQAHRGRYKLFNILIFEIWKPKFHHRQKILSVVLFDMTGSLCSFSRKDLPDIQVFITLVLSVSHSFK